MKKIYFLLSAFSLLLFSNIQAQNLELIMNEKKIIVEGTLIEKLKTTWQGETVAYYWLYEATNKKFIITSITYDKDQIPTDVVKYYLNQADIDFANIYILEEENEYFDYKKVQRLSILPFITKKYSFKSERIGQYDEEITTKDENFCLLYLSTKEIAQNLWDNMVSKTK
ncbi:MAG: hypothetical protein EAZ55_02110 [Cytophagales bacterium]|nr:MAG: hypothetical protein EAZ55_02110 [Cytophagales bacterium]